MKKTSLIISLSLLTNILFAQVNLVSNGDFEIYSSLPTWVGQCNLAVGWNNVNGDYTEATASPDYFYNPISGILAEFGPLNPYSGKGQMGLGIYDSYDLDPPNYREYISTQLSSTMLPGHLYRLSFNITNGVDTIFTQACNNFGICFSNNPLFQATYEPISVIPQIEIDSIIYFYNYWQYFSFNYIADSSYKFITIGNFKDDAHTLLSTTGKNGAYYFIDKIEIIPYLYITGDTIICKGDTATLIAMEDSTVNWANSLKPDSIISTDIIIKVNPDTTTTYLAYGSNNDTASFTVHVVNPPIINLGKDDTLCQGKLLTLNAGKP